MRFSGSDLIKKLESLKPAVFLPQIEARITELEEVLKTKQFAVKKNPSGLVRIVRRGKTLLFYKRYSSFDAQGTYMPRSQEKLARALIQNDYDKKTIPAIQAEICLYGNTEVKPTSSKATPSPGLAPLTKTSVTRITRRS